MFSNLFGGGKTLQVDAREWHPDADKALALFDARDWTNLSLLVARQSPSAAFKLVTAIGERSQLDAVLGEPPPTPILQTILGGVKTAWAWRHRGFGTADEVDEDRWPRFFGALDEAREFLTSALELRENDALALGFLGRVATGQQDEDLLDTVDKAFMAAPEKSMDACVMLLQARAAKWGGSHDDMYERARAFADDQRLHPARKAIYARAHVERWLYDAFMDDDEAVNVKGQQLIGDSDFVSDILQLNQDYFDLLQSTPGAQADWAARHFAHNNLGFPLYLTGRKQEAAFHVDALAARPATWPWVYSLGDPIEKEWKRLRKSLGLPGQVKLVNATSRND